MYKSILLLANPDSIHVYNYVRNILVPEHYKVTILNYNGRNTNIKEDFLNYYHKNGVTLIDGINPMVVWRPSYYSYCKKFSAILKSIGSFDVLHVHYVKDYVVFPIIMNKHNYGKIVLTFYGSDIYRIGNLRFCLLLPLLNVADNISLISNDMLSEISRKTFVSKRIIEKCSIADFGNMFYNEIDNLIKCDKKDDCKISFGFNKDKILVTVGYVGRPQMQQLEALNQIKQSTAYKSNIIEIAIPAYGMTKQLRQDIEYVLSESKVKYNIFEQFMGEEEVSKLRVATDIFVHTQTTDALSCAMLEHLYAGSVVINGAWLKYKTLDEWEVSYEKIGTMQELPMVLDNVIKNTAFGMKRDNRNSSIVYQHTSWESLKDSWINLYYDHE